MLHKTVVLANLQVYCATRESESNKIAGRLRNLFYAASLPWHDGNLGRVIPLNTLEDFYGEYQKLRDAFYKLRASVPGVYNITLTIIPFPAKPFSHVVSTKLEEAPYIVSNELKHRFDKRIFMLESALEGEKRFYASLLSELKRVIEVGLYLEKDIDPQLLSRMKSAQADILCYSAEDIRKSASLREDIINTCGALL